MVRRSRTKEIVVLNVKYKTVLIKNFDFFKTILASQYETCYIYELNSSVNINLY